MRVALYARVSTNRHKCRACRKFFQMNGVESCPECGSTDIERGQNVETQLIPLRDYARSRGFDVAAEYVDIGISGSKNSRPELNRMMTDARRRKIDSVIVWKFDRFGRSLRDLVTSLEEFRALGIQFISLTETIDTSTPIGQVMFALIAAMAQFERDLIRERVIVGMARARKEGKQIGRRNKIIDREKVRTVYAETGSLRKTAEACGIGKDLVSSIIKP